MSGYDDPIYRLKIFSVYKYKIFFWNTKKWPKSSVKVSMLKSLVKCMDNFIIPKTKTPFKHVPSNQQYRCSIVKTQNLTPVDGGIPLDTCRTSFWNNKTPPIDNKFLSGLLRTRNDVFRGESPRKYHKTRSRKAQEKFIVDRGSFIVSNGSPACIKWDTTIDGC